MYVYMYVCVYKCTCTCMCTDVVEDLMSYFGPVHLVPGPDGGHLHRADHTHLHGALQQVRSTGLSGTIVLIHDNTLSEKS